MFLSEQLSANVGNLLQNESKGFSRRPVRLRLHNTGLARPVSPPITSPITPGSLLPSCHVAWFGHDDADGDKVSDNHDAEAGVKGRQLSRCSPAVLSFGREACRDTPQPTPGH